MLTSLACAAKPLRYVKAYRNGCRARRRFCTAEAKQEITQEEIAETRKAIEKLFDSTEDVPNQFAKDSTLL